MTHLGEPRVFSPGQFFDDTYGGGVQPPVLDIDLVDRIGKRYPGVDMYILGNVDLLDQLAQGGAHHDEVLDLPLGSDLSVEISPEGQAVLNVIYGLTESRLIRSRIDEDDGDASILRQGTYKGKTIYFDEEYADGAIVDVHVYTEESIDPALLAEPTPEPGTAEPQTGHTPRWRAAAAKILSSFRYADF